MYCKSSAFCEKIIISRSPFSNIAETLLFNFAEDKDVDAVFSVGVLLQEKYIKNDNPSECVKYYEHAANLGHKFAMRNLGILYQVGAGVEMDWDKAAYWYEKAVLEGDLISAENMNFIFSNGWRPNIGNLKIYDWNEIILKLKGARSKTFNFEVIISLPSIEAENEIKGKVAEKIVAETKPSEVVIVEKPLNIEKRQRVSKRSRPLRTGSLQKRLLGRIYAN